MLNPRFFAPGTGTSAMMDGELKKTSVRANRLEKKRFEMMLSTYDSAKKNVVMEMKRSQIDVKKRLKRYKDRQREILYTKLEPPSSNTDDDIMRQIRRLSQTKSGPLRRQTLSSSSLPSSFQAIPQDNLTDAAGGTSDLGTADRDTTTTITTAASTSTLGSVTLPPPDADKDVPTQPSGYHLHHQQKSKADLRPYIAWSVMHNSSSPDPSPSFRRSTTTTTSSIKHLQLRGGRIGTASKQVRYLDEEEIEQRCSFHRLLLDKYRSLENQRLERINDMVGEFCGKGSGNRFVASCPPLFEEGVTSLPPGVPASIHRAMRVKMFPLNSVDQWAKGSASVVPRHENK